MAKTSRSSWLQSLCSLVLLASTVQALKFDLLATVGHDPRRERCIRNFVSKDTLVVVTATVSGYRGDGMTVNMHVRLQNPPRPVGLAADCSQREIRRR
jgi:p24 family protein delta-1